MAHLLRLLFFTLGILTLLIAGITPAAAILIYTHPPRIALHGSPADLGLAYDNVSFHSRLDQVRLDGWFIPSAGSTRMIILLHGMNGNRWMPDAFPQLSLRLHQHGFNVLTFDFRGEGTSASATATLGFHEQYDVLGAVDYVRSRLHNPTAHFGLIGHSMGASTALLAAADDPTDIRAVVADSAFADLSRLVNADVTKVVGSWSSIVTWTILHETPLLTGFDPAAVKPLQALRSLTHTPVFYIAGTADDMVPCSDALELYQHTPDRGSQLWLVPGAFHVWSYHMQPKIYLSRILAFFQHSLS
jgi:pimeloyl-ACP methyl ester carboxylesterase